MTHIRAKSLGAAGLACALTLASGCGLPFLIRAAKGEVAPIGVDQASGSDISSMARTVQSTDDPAALAKAFTDLTSIYLFKCMQSPTKAPTKGSAELREAAGQKLVTAMTQRVSERGVDDPAMSASAANIAPLEGKLGKCDASKRAEQDPNGWFPMALSLSQPEGRSQYVQEAAAELDAKLQVALSNDAAAWKWVTDDCSVRLPEWSYCAPRLVDAYWAADRVDAIFEVVLVQAGREGTNLLESLGSKVGHDVIVEKVRSYVRSGEAVELHPRGLDLMATYLRGQGAWGDCGDRKGLLRALIRADDDLGTEWAIETIVQDECRNLDGELIKAMGSDSPYTRELAVWAAGELKIKKAKKHVSRLRWSDPFFDDSCWCRPVRDAAAVAYNKLELSGG